MDVKRFAVRGGCKPRCVIAIAAAALLSAAPGWAATEGSSNNYFGTGAGGTGGSLNSFFGAYAGDVNTGSYNTGVGYYVLRSNTSGPFNTAIGSHALFSNTTGSSNAAVGYYALFDNTEGGGNTAIGTRVLESNTTGSGNTAIGSVAMLGNTTGNDNTAVGNNSLLNNTTGYDNTATGMAALLSNETGTKNTAIGTYALSYSSAGNYNTASGYSALANTEASANTATGYQAMYGDFYGTNTGQHNAAHGAFSLRINDTGDSNTAMGYAALNSNSSGYQNTAVGRDALLSNVGGHDNIAVGYGAGDALTSGNNNIYIGNAGKDSENNVIRIGSNQTKTLIAGIAGTSLTGASVVVDSNGRLGVIASSQRYKQDIQDLADPSDRLARLRPVSYQYKTEPGRLHYGLIAEEVAQVMPEVVVYNAEQQPESVQYQELIPLLLQTVQAQQARIAELEATGQRQQADIVALRDVLAARVAELEDRLAASGMVASR